MRQLFIFVFIYIFLLLHECKRGLAVFFGGRECKLEGIVLVLLGNTRGVAR